MTVLLDVLTWWPWNADREIRHVTKATQAPGLVTLGWRTEGECPTVLERPDGTVLYREDVPRCRHLVTLSGLVGDREAVVIRSAVAARTVDVHF